MNKFDNILKRGGRYFWVYDPAEKPVNSKDRSVVEKHRAKVLAERQRIAGRPLTNSEEKDGWNPRIIELRRAAEAESTLR